MKPIIPLLLSLACCLTVPAANGGNIITYAETEHNSFEVFDLASGWFSFGDRSILGTPLGTSDLGVPLRPCMDPE